MKLSVIVLPIILLIAVLFIVFSNFSGARRYMNIEINGFHILAEIADTPQKRETGLMGRTELNENEGMIFEFLEEDYYKFWMFNMSIPIDIIYISKNKTVVDIWKDAQPCKENCTEYSPNKKIMYVLEVKANFSDRHNVKTGDRAYF